MSAGNDKLERELDSFLADDSRVAALYRKLPKDEPDAKLDAAILAQARAAVVPRRARPRWLPAMSAAAAVVIAAGLAYRVGPKVWSERSAVSEQAEQRVAAPASAPPEAPKDAAPVPQAEKSMSLRTEAVTSNAIPKQDVARARDVESDKLQSQKRKAEDQKTAASAFAKQSAQGQLKTENGLLDRANPANAPTGVAREQPETMQAAPPQRRDAAPTPPVETSPAIPAKLVAPAPKPSAPEPNAFPAAAGAAAAPPPSTAAPAARAPARETTQTSVDIEARLYPEHWISDIQQMLKDGRRDDAIRNVKAFHKLYPDYTLPENLRDLK